MIDLHRLRTNTKAGLGAALASLALLTLFTTGCPARERDVDIATRNGILLLGNKVEPLDLDPQTTTGVQEINIHMALFEGLVSPHPETLEPEPGVAERWEVSDDGLTLTFHLRQDAKWSDGQPLTSADFLYSWRRILSMDLAAKNTFLLFPIKGARAFGSGVGEFSSVGVQAPDAHTLVVELERPTPWFLSMLMHPAFYPVPQHVVEAKGGTASRASGWTQPATMVGNGPFRLTQWVPNSIIKTAKNPQYWDAANVKLNGIHFFPIENLGSEETAFLGGQLHMTDALPGNKVRTYQNQTSPYLRVEPYLGVYYYMVNTAHPALKDPRVRLALALSVDRRVLIDAALGGVQAPAASFTAPGIHDYAPPPVQSFDLDRAKALLAEAGFPDAQGMPRLEILYNTSENHARIAEVLQAMWKQHLGVEVALRNEEYASYLNSRDTGNFQLARSSWVADYPAPAAFLETLASWSGNNFSGWRHPRYDSLLKQAESVADDAERNILYTRAETILLEQAPVIPLYHYQTVYLIHPAVKGWHPTPLDWHPYKYVSLETPAAKK